MSLHDNRIEPEFAVGDTVTYMPYGAAYQATVTGHRFYGPVTHPDEINYRIKIDSDLIEADWIVSCREIYESGMFAKSHSISWG